MHKKWKKYTLSFYFLSEKHLFSSFDFHHMPSYVKSLCKEATSIFYPIFSVIHMSQDKNFFYEKYSCYCRAPQWQSCWLSIKRHIKRLWHLHCIVISFKRISLLIYFFAFYVFFIILIAIKIKTNMCFIYQWNND